MTKFELPLAVTYVPNWGIVEAFRELFQNALDNQIENPENTMGFVYDEQSETLSITNKTSSLEADSLLLGSTTKAHNENTIGNHGEGYKLAFMILLRNNKKVTVHNYGKRELWNVRFVTSKKYNNQLVTTVFVDKKHMWEKVPDNDLTIIVQGITPDEYAAIVKSNLNLREDTLKYIKCTKGRILTDESESGNIYVKGLFIHNNKEFTYGYDFEPNVIKLDRDRKMLDSIVVSFETSELWMDASRQSEENKQKVSDMFYTNVYDVKYITQSFVSGYRDANNMIAQKFLEDNGDNAVPVVSNVEYEEVKESGKTPVIVREDIKEAIIKSKYADKVYVEKRKTVKELFIDFMGEIESKLTDEELTYMQDLIDKISN